MFGGIAAGAAGDRLYLATSDGAVISLDLEGGAVTGHFRLAPMAPSPVDITACAVAADGSLLLADRLHKCVRRYDTTGLALGRFGERATPGIAVEDGPGILDEPWAVLPDATGLLVGSGARGVHHGLQHFRRSGGYESSWQGPSAEWGGIAGLARVQEEVWAADGAANAVRRFDAGGEFRGSVRLHPELRSPFRLAPDGYGSALLLLAPQEESEGDEAGCGVVHLPADGAFGGWLVTAGERAGSVHCPFDLALLPDGRFVVADLPLGQPPDVRIQVFGPDGRLSAILVEDALSLAEKQTAWFQRVLREGSAYEKARVHHDYGACAPDHGAGAPDHGAEAERLYRAVLASSPRHLPALWGLATLMAESLNRPEEAEKHFLEAIAAGGSAGDLTARMAECRRARGDLDGAIALLHGAIDGPNPPEEYHRLLDVLGGYYLERAGESSEGMI